MNVFLYLYSNLEVVLRVEPEQQILLAVLLVLSDKNEKKNAETKWRYNEIV